MDTITKWWVLGGNANEETKLVCLYVENELHKMRFTEDYLVYGVVKIAPKLTVARLITVNIVPDVNQKYSKVK